MRSFYKLTIITLCVVMSFNSVVSQAILEDNNIYLSNLNYNPSIIGLQKIRVQYRSILSPDGKITESPQSHSLAGSILSGESGKFGLGMSGNYSVDKFLSVTTFNGAVSYKLIDIDESSLLLGISAGVSQYMVDIDKYPVTSETTYSYLEYLTKKVDTKADYNVGIGGTFLYKGFKLGLTYSDLLKNKIVDSVKTNLFNYRYKYLANISYQFSLTDNIVVSPEVSYSKNVNNTNMVSAGLNTLLNEKYIFNSMIYKYSDMASLSTMVGVNINNYTIGYVFKTDRYSSSDNFNYHGVFVSYKINSEDYDDNKDYIRSTKTEGKGVFYDDDVESDDEEMSKEEYEKLEEELKRENINTNYEDDDE